MCRCKTKGSKTPAGNINIGHGNPFLSDDPVCVPMYARLTRVIGQVLL